MFENGTLKIMFKSLDRFGEPKRCNLDCEKVVIASDVPYVMVTLKGDHSITFIPNDVIFSMTFVSDKPE